MVFTSKTLIPWKQPIGQNRDGSYIYDWEPMSVMPKKTVTPITTQSTGIPNVGIPWIKGLTTPIAPSTSSKLPPVTFSPERAKAINAPVNDVKGILQVDRTQPRVQQLEQHIKSLKEKWELKLNAKQSEYIKRYKQKLPEYASIPDAILYGRIIIKYPEAMEKYGNIGERSFLNRVVNLPLDIAKAGAEWVNEAIVKWEERKATLGEDSTFRKWLSYLGVPKSSTITDIATTGRALWNVAMGVAWSITNLASPLMNQDKNVTSITEWLQKDVGTAIQSVPEPVRNQVSQLIEKHPIISTYLGQWLDILNIIPVLWVLNKAKSAGQVETILKEVKARPATKFRWEVSPEIYKAGTERSLISDIAWTPKKVVKAVTPDIISKDAVTLKAERIRKGFETQNNNLKSVGNSYKKNTKTYTLDDWTKQTVTPVDTIAKYDISPEITDKTIKMWDYKATKEGALWKIQENIEMIGDEIDSTLVATGKKVRLSDMKQKAINAVKNDPELKQAGKVSSTLKKLEDRFDDYEISYWDELDITEVNNIRKVANKDWSPDTQDVSSIVGDVSRDIVYNSTDDLYVRNLLREQWNLLAARKYAEVINGTKVRWWRLWDLVSGGAWAVAGAVAGTMIPIPVVWPAIWAAVWQQAWSRLSKLFSAGQFKSPTAEFKWLFSKSVSNELPKIKVSRVPKDAIKSIEWPKATIKESSSSLPVWKGKVSNDTTPLPAPLSQISKKKTPVKQPQPTKWKNILASKDIKNSPIISQISKKQTPTPKAKVSPEDISLQESIPTMKSSVEVPEGYMPKDWLPTGTEFENSVISQISKTRKIPSPDVKRPQIRGIKITRPQMISSMKEQWMFTDSFFLISDKKVASKFIDYAEQKAIKNWEQISWKDVNISSFMDRGKSSANIQLTPKEYLKWKYWTYLNLAIDWEKAVHINASYADIFFKNFDDVTFKWSNELSPVLVLSKWNPVWLIMPVKQETWNKLEKIGDFSLNQKSPTKVESKLPAKPVGTVKKDIFENSDMTYAEKKISMKKTPTKEEMDLSKFTDEKINIGDDITISHENMYGNVQEYKWKVRSIDFGTPSKKPEMKEIIIETANWLETVNMTAGTKSKWNVAKKSPTKVESKLPAKPVGTVKTIDEIKSMLQDKPKKPARMVELEKKIQDYKDEFMALDKKVWAEEAKKIMMPEWKPNPEYIKARDELLEYRWSEDAKGNVTRKLYSDDTPEQIWEHKIWMKNNPQVQSPTKVESKLPAKPVGTVSAEMKDVISKYKSADEFVEQWLKQFDNAEAPFWSVLVWTDIVSMYEKIYWVQVWPTANWFQPSKNIRLVSKQLRDIYNKPKPPTKRALPMSQKSDVVYSKPTLESEARKYKSAEEFVKKEAIRKRLISEWTKINSDDTVTLYHATGNKKDILNQWEFKWTRAAPWGMVNVDLGDNIVYFWTDKDWVQRVWSRWNSYDIVEVKVPLEYIRKPAQNELEVYFEWWLKRKWDIWIPWVKPQSTHYDKIAEMTFLTDKEKQQLLDIYNKANKK
jgi:hypothetical protein